MVQFRVLNMQDFVGRLEDDRQVIVQAGRQAVKAEGYRLKGLLQQEIKAGAPGGAPFSPLTEIAKWWGKRRNRKPLERLAQPVRYRAQTIQGGYSVKVGYLVEDIADPSIKSRSRISRSWARIVQANQEGQTIQVTEEIRKRFRTVGSGLKGRWVKAGRSGARMMTEHKVARVFFLRKDTSQLRVPARPIIDPFWSRYAAQASANINENFRRKLNWVATGGRSGAYMQGEWI